MQQTTAFEQARQAAGTFSIQHQINYISSHLLCCAAIEHAPAGDSFLADEDKAIFLQKLFADVLAQSRIDVVPEAEVPLTFEARTIMILALQYQHAFEDEALDICHYLLAVLSCNTKAAELFKERGWVFRNYLEWLTANRNIKIDFPDQLYPATDYIPRRHKITFSQSIFSRKTKEAIAQQYIADSLQLLEYGDYDRALQAIDLAKDAPRNENYYLNKAFVELRAKKYPQALKTINDALKHGVAPEKLYLGQARCLCEAGSYDACIEVCKAQLPTTQYVSDAHNMIGFALAKRDYHQEAVAHYDKALQLLPDYAAALNNKGFSLFRLGLVDDAISFVQASLQIDKGNSYAYRNLALIAHHIGQTDTASALRDKAFLFGYREDFGSDLDRWPAGNDKLAVPT